MQKRIDEIQSKYREWCHLLPQLEEDIRRWKHAVALIRYGQFLYPRVSAVPSSH